MLSLSLIFNEDYYLRENPDVAAAVARGDFESGFQHFQLNGVAEGRNPGEFFNVSFYLEQNPDVAASGLNAVDHFLEFGAGESRSPNAFFNAAYYLEQNQDHPLCLQ